MKKIYLYPIFLLVVSGFLTSKSIFAVRTDRTIYYGIPNSAMIYWSYSRDINPSSKVKIALLDSQGQYFCTIVRDLPITLGSSGYHWDISHSCLRDNGTAQNITYGTYSIRVRLTGTSVMGESPPFELSSAPGLLRVYDVRTDRNRYVMGGRAKVFWRSSTPSPGIKVKIVLLNEQRQYVCTLERNVPCEAGIAGHYVTLGPTCRRDNGMTEKLSSGKYAIRIRVENSQKKAEGNLFYLLKIVQPEIKGPPLRLKTEVNTKVRLLNQLRASFEITTEIAGNGINFNSTQSSRALEKEWTGEVVATINFVGFSISAQVSNRSDTREEVKVCHFVDHNASSLPVLAHFIPSSSTVSVSPGQTSLLQDSLKVSFSIAQPESRNRTYTFVIKSAVKRKDASCSSPGGQLSPTFKSIIHIRVPDF